jgi:hypothetical protein
MTTTEIKESLIKQGYRIQGGYIQKYIDSDTEPKQYWEGRPKTFEFQIWGWQIIAHESKINSLISLVE